jgi:flagellar biosynthesis GTPase FlhF
MKGSRHKITPDDHTFASRSAAAINQILEGVHYRDLEQVEKEEKDLLHDVDTETIKRADKAETKRRQQRERRNRDSVKNALKKEEDASLQAAQQEAEKQHAAEQEAARQEAAERKRIKIKRKLIEIQWQGCQGKFTGCNSNVLVDWDSLQFHITEDSGVKSKRLKHLKTLADNLDLAPTLDINMNQFGRCPTYAAPLQSFWCSQAPIPRPPTWHPLHSGYNDVEDSKIRRLLGLGTLD